MKSKEDYIEFFKEKANYLSNNVGSGELWNRTEFFNKIVGILLEVADTVQKDTLENLKNESTN